MVDGGVYSKNGRIVGIHVGVDPLYITQYMKKLDVFYEIHKKNENIAVLIYYNFITIHPFSDGNGHVGKALLYILKDRNYKGITTKKNHTKLCHELGRMQRQIDSMFNVYIGVNNLKKY